MVLHDCTTNNYDSQQLHNHICIQHSNNYFEITVTDRTKFTGSHFVAEKTHLHWSYLLLRTYTTQNLSLKWIKQIVAI